MQQIFADHGLQRRLHGRVVPHQHHRLHFRLRGDERQIGFAAGIVHLIDVDDIDAFVESPLPGLGGLPAPRCRGLQNEIGAVTPVCGKVGDDLRFGKAGLVQSPVEIPFSRRRPGGLGVAQKINSGRERCCQGRGPAFECQDTD